METGSMYRRPKFLELLLEVRQQMARDADYDVDLFAEMIRSGSISQKGDAEGSDVMDSERITSARRGNTDAA